MINKPELLAPAGSRSSLLAGIRCGANAVYFGLRDFNARRTAENFGVEDLPELVRYCHERNVKAHLTLNTLVADTELHDVAKLIESACSAGVDALIVQDFGLLSFLRSVAPRMSLHASTQMSVHTLAGVDLLAESGFTRAVLSRELSLTELEKITEKSPIELEVFVHGALCMSVSGQCYMSVALGERSGNRGLCAQPCRLPFSASGGNGHDLSLKDLCAIKQVGELKRLGIASFKIEGRMKRPEYVAAAVSVYRAAIDETESNAASLKDLKTVFSRSGFTDGYLTGKTGKEMFGIREKEAPEELNDTLSRLSGLYKNENPLLPVKMHFTASVGVPCILEMSCGKFNHTVTSEKLCTEAKNHSVGEAEVIERLSKCGGTQFYAAEVLAEIGDGVYIPAAEINNLRRLAITGISERLSETSKIHYDSQKADKLFPTLFQAQSVAQPKLYLRISDISQLENISLDCVNNVILPVETDIRLLSEIEEKDKIILELPRAMFGAEERLDKLLNSVKQEGFTSVCANNIGALEQARRYGFRLIGGFGLNVYNSLAANALNQLGVDEQIMSFELNSKRFDAIKCAGLKGAIVYGRLPLMLTRNCPGGICGKSRVCFEALPEQNRTGCRKEITDRKGEHFPIRCRFGAVEIFNSRPLYLLDSLDKIKSADFHVLYFTVETPREVKSILDKYRDGAPPEMEFTRGCYLKKVE